jgi:hypothetical protein
MHAFVLAVTLAAATGSLKPQPQPPAAKHIDIDDDEVVEGNKVDPDGDAMFARKRSRFGTLIKLRESFTPELLKSAE